MFSDLKKGFQVHTLDTNTVPKYELGKVVAVSEPRYLPPQPGQYQTMQTRVVNREGDVELSAVAGAVKRQNVLV